MLIEFKLKNFKSFKDEQTFTLVANSDKNLANNLITPTNFGKQRVLKSAVIYGANASGKSNLIQALEFVEKFVLTSFIRPIGSDIFVQPYLLDAATENSPTEFEIHFISQNIRYQYGFALDKKRIYEEWLIAYPKGQPQTWFERTPKPDSEESEWYFGPKFTDKRLKIHENTRPNVLFLSAAVQNNSKQLLGVYEWFNHCLLTLDINSDIERVESSYKLRLSQKPELGERIKSLLQQADLGIMDYSIEKKSAAFTLPQNAPEELQPLLREFSALNSKLEASNYEIRFKHKTAEDNEGVFLPWKDESFGTRRLFALSGPLLDVLEEGMVLVVDELDASLHPLLLRALVQLFHDPKINKNNAQLIFNTHDTTLQDLTLLRRDQFWVVEKIEGASKLVPYSDYSLRNNEALQKGYLQGRYGGVPLLSDSILPDFSTKEVKVAQA